MAVIAHPWGRGRERPCPAEILRALAAEHGLDGIEVDHHDHDAETRSRLRRLADELGLLATGSSDYHGTGKIDHDLGSNTTDPAGRTPQLRDRLAVDELTQGARLPVLNRRAECGAMPTRAWVLAVANQKGGVAKTTTVGSLGAAWSRAGTARCCWSTSIRRPA